MLSQNQIKHITSLKIKKFREEQNQFIAEGHKLVTDLVCSKFQVAGIYAISGWIASHGSRFISDQFSVVEVSPREMERISALSSPSPVLAVVNIPAVVSTCPPVHLPTRSLTLALDDIRDPGNLGTIIRIADWFGIHTIICSESCVDIYNPKVVQATMGSIARVEVIRCNLPDTLEALSNPVDSYGEMLPIYGTFLEGKSVFTEPLSSHGVIVIGNESHGISPELIPCITHKLFIPSFGSSAHGKAESLNASIATAIICAEFRKNPKISI